MYTPKIKVPQNMSHTLTCDDHDTILINLPSRHIHMLQHNSYLSNPYPSLPLKPIFVYYNIN